MLLEMPDSRWTVVCENASKRFVWLYVFSKNGTVRWKDEGNGMTGSGTWRIQGGKLHTKWLNSATTEEWNHPIDPGNWTGSCKMKGLSYSLRAVARDNIEPAAAPSEENDNLIWVDLITDDPRTHSLYIDSLCAQVGYGIYNGGFYVYVPRSVSEHPLIVPEKMLWFGATALERVSDTIFPTQADAFAAVGTSARPDRVAYYWGAGVVCPTAFTMSTTPTIVNTARIVVDQLVNEVQNELIAIAIPIIGGMIGRQILARLARARPVGKGPPPRLMRPDDPSPPRPKPPITSRRRATRQELQDIINNPQNYVTHRTPKEPVANGELPLEPRGEHNPLNQKEIYAAFGTGKKDYGSYGITFDVNKVGVRTITGVADEVHITSGSTPNDAGIWWHQSDLNGLKKGGP
jgi:hypothetical protein